jgi:MraZ protein
MTEKWGRKGAMSLNSKENDGQRISEKAPGAEPPETPAVRFIGSYNHSLDSKGRLVIPQGFREKLGDYFCIAPSYDFSSISVYPTEMWEKRNRTYERLGTLNPAVNAYLEQFYALSYDRQSCDAQGRILLPVNIRNKILNEERDVEITGANDHIRIIGAKNSLSGWENFRNNLPELLQMIAALDQG